MVTKTEILNDIRTYLERLSEKICESGIDDDFNNVSETIKLKMIKFEAMIKLLYCLLRNQDFEQADSKEEQSLNAALTQVSLRSKVFGDGSSSIYEKYQRYIAQPTAGKVTEAKIDAKDELSTQVITELTKHSIEISHARFGIINFSTKTIERLMDLFDNSQLVRFAINIHYSALLNIINKNSGFLPRLAHAFANIQQFVEFIINQYGELPFGNFDGAAYRFLTNTDLVKLIEQRLIKTAADYVYLATQYKQTQAGRFIPSTPGFAKYITDPKPEGLGLDQKQLDWVFYRNDFATARLICTASIAQRAVETIDKIELRAALHEREYQRKMIAIVSYPNAARRFFLSGANPADCTYQLLSSYSYSQHYGNSWSIKACYDIACHPETAIDLAQNISADEFNTIFQKDLPFNNIAHLLAERSNTAIVIARRFYTNAQQFIDDALTIREKNLAATLLQQDDVLQYIAGLFVTAKQLLVFKKMSISGIHPVYLIAEKIQPKSKNDKLPSNFFAGLKPNEIAVFFDYFPELARYHPDYIAPYISTAAAAPAATDIKTGTAATADSKTGTGIHDEKDKPAIKITQDKLIVLQAVHTYIAQITNDISQKKSRSDYRKLAEQSEKNPLLKLQGAIKILHQLLTAKPDEKLNVSNDDEKFVNAAIMQRSLRNRWDKSGLRNVYDLYQHSQTATVQATAQKDEKLAASLTSEQVVTRLIECCVIALKLGHLFSSQTIDRLLDLFNQEQLLRFANRIVHDLLYLLINDHLRFTLDLAKSFATVKEFADFINLHNKVTLITDARRIIRPVIGTNFLENKLALKYVEEKLLIDARAYVTLFTTCEPAGFCFAQINRIANQLLSDAPPKGLNSEQFLQLATKTRLVPILIHTPQLAVKAADLIADDKAFTEICDHKPEVLIQITNNPSAMTGLFKRCFDSAMKIQNFIANYVRQPSVLHKIVELPEIAEIVATHATDKQLERIIDDADFISVIDRYPKIAVALAQNVYKDINTLIQHFRIAISRSKRQDVATNRNIVAAMLKHPEAAKHLASIITAEQLLRLKQNSVIGLHPADLIAEQLKLSQNFFASSNKEKLIAELCEQFPECGAITAIMIAEAVPALPKELITLTTQHLFWKDAKKEAKAEIASTSAAMPTGPTIAVLPDAEKDKKLDEKGKKTPASTGALRPKQ